MRHAFVLVLVLIGGTMLAALTMQVIAHRGESATSANLVEAWETTGDLSYRFDYQTRYFNPGPGDSPVKIQVSETIAEPPQQMDGFGAALTDSSAWLIYHAPEITRTMILSALFSFSDGVGISYLRLPIGASDFVTGTQHYTYDDVPPGITDTQLISFSIAHDQAYIIPVLKQALEINPELRIVASPWSPPAWMKSPESLYGGSLNMEYCEVYANYFVKFIQAYQDEGITITAVTVQNEPYYPATPGITTTYPTMHMEPSEQAYFVKNCLGPAFIQNEIDTKIFIWDHNWSDWPYPLAVLSDPAAGNYIAGSAWHCYGGTPDQQTIVHNAHPDKEIYFTECTSGGDDEGTPDDLVWGVHNVTVGTTRNWAETVLYWNVVLDEQHGPHLGGCSNCRGLVTLGPTGVVSQTVEYYVLGHLSKFVDPGAIRIESSYITGTLESVAFQNKNTDQSIVLIVLNPGMTTQAFDVQWHGNYFSYSLEAKSVTTFRWQMIYDIYLPLVLIQYRPPF